MRARQKGFLKPVGASEARFVSNENLFSLESFLYCRRAFNSLRLILNFEDLYFGRYFLSKILGLAINPKLLKIFLSVHSAFSER
jgi:hypothetical protein